MSNWKDIPHEILNLVFERITDYSTLTQCQLTCKNWSEEAQKQIYKYVFLQEREQFSKLLWTLVESGTDIRRHLKHICLDPWDEVIGVAKHMRAILLVCPNIEILELFPDGNGGVFAEIQLACKYGYCKRLKYTPTLGRNSSEADYELYLDVAYRLHNSLEHLVLDDSFVKSPSDSLLQKLKEFPYLNSLVIYGVECTESIYQIVKCIEGCPGVTSLELTCWVPQIGTKEDIKRNVRSSSQCLALEHLSLCSFPITSELLEYIMYAFPNMTSFFMKADSTIDDSNDISIKISKNLGLQFLVYLTTRSWDNIYIQCLNISDTYGVLISQNRIPDVFYRHS